MFIYYIYTYIYYPWKLGLMEIGSNHPRLGIWVGAERTQRSVGCTMPREKLGMSLIAVNSG